MTQFKPMKPPSESISLEEVTYPIGASPKLDGIRAVVKDGILVSNTLKPIRNKYTQALFGRNEYEGLDGELIVGEPNSPDCYRNTNSGVMSIEGEPDVNFWVFDFCFASSGFQTRHASAMKFVNDYAPERIKIVPHSLIESRETLEIYESAVIDMGYEGIILRAIDGRYKFGRCTKKEAIAFKFKRFNDSEAEIVGSIELFRNMNEAVRNGAGNIERSSSALGKVPANTLGAWELRDIHTGVEFECGCFRGVTDHEKEVWWKNRANLLGSIVKYKFFPYGVKDKPRHPVFLGFRDEEDIG